MDNFTEWNEIKIETHTKVSNIVLKEGQVRWCRVGLNIGNETDGKGGYFLRPILVLKKFSSDVFLGLPLTSKPRSGSWFYTLNHAEVTQIVILNQGRLLDRKRLQAKMFEISEKELARIKKAYAALILS